MAASEAAAGLWRALRDEPALRVMRQLREHAIQVRVAGLELTTPWLAGKFTRAHGEGCGPSLRTCSLPVTPGQRTRTRRTRSTVCPTQRMGAHVRSHPSHKAGSADPEPALTCVGTAGFEPATP